MSQPALLFTHFHYGSLWLVAVGVGGSDLPFKWLALPWGGADVRPISLRHSPALPVTEVRAFFCSAGRSSSPLARLRAEIACTLSS